MPAQDREAIIKISAKNLTEDEFKKVKKGLAGIGTSAKQSNTKVSGLQRGVASFSKAAPGALKIVTAAAVATAAAVVGIAAAVIKLGERGAAVGDVALAFDQLSLKVGETGEVMLGALREGVKGTITDFDLMKVANKALGTGLLKTNEDARTMAEGARLLAKRTGGDTVVAFETLTTAMASGRTAQLKQIGLFVDNKKAIADYAEATGKSVADINDAERAQALQVATMAALRRELEGFPPPLSDFGELLERGRVGVKNFTDALAVSISESPVLLAAMTSIGEAISGAFGSEQQGFILTVTNLIEKAAIGVVTFALSAVEGAQAVTNSWGGIQFVILGVTKVFVFLTQKMAEQSARQLELASQIPVLGRAYESAAKEARAVADEGALWSASLQEQLQTAALAAQGHTALGEKLAVLKGHLMAVQTAQVNAGLTQRDFNLATQVGTTSVANLGTASDIMKEKLAAAYAVLIEGKGHMEEMGIEAKAWDGVMQDVSENIVLAQGNINAAFDFTRINAQVNAFQIAGAFGRMGVTMQTELQRTADQMKIDFDRIEKDGTLSGRELEKLWKEVELAKQKASGETTAFTLTSNEAITIGGKKMLSELGRKHKGAAIASAVIGTAESVVQALRSSPPPGSWILAGINAALGAAQIAAIKSAPGFREGTSALDFQNFGASTRAVMHGREAIIPQGKGHMLAREIADAMSSRSRGGDPEVAMALGELRASLAGLRNLPRQIQRAMRDGIQLAAV